MYTPDFTHAVWRKSSRSNAGNGGACVEVAFLPGVVGVRDSKHRNGPILRFTTDDWGSFLDAVSVER